MPGSIVEQLKIIEPLANKLPKGGHFAAREQPRYFVSEMRASFKSLRELAVGQWATRNPFTQWC